MNEEYEMTQEREASILERAVETFGPGPQTDMMIEEMSELTKALCKYRRAVGGGADEAEVSVRKDQVLEEMADVQIMLNQMVLIYGDFNEQEIAKLLRLDERLATRGNKAVLDGK